MRSCPREPAAPALLSDLGRAYDAALDAARRGDAARVAHLIVHADAIVAGLAAAPAAVPAAALESVRERYGRLVDATAEMHARLADELARVRQARQCVRAYGSRAAKTGRLRACEA
jgi:hypothetical protein